MNGRKLLTIVIVGRNDDYLGGYRYRLQTCLDFLASNLKALGRLDDVEVLFVDWNSQGATLDTEIQLTPEAASMLKFVIVPSAVAKARNMQVSFFTTCAVNVGVRRAEGEFIMLADSDSMMPLPSLKALLETLDGTLPTHFPKEQLIYPIPRHQIPGAVAARRPNVSAWTEILKRLMASRRKELPSGDCLGGFSAAQLMHRDLWFEFGGYNEKLDRAWGWSDNELMFRVTQKYNWMDLGYYGVVAFHIEHFASTGNAHSRDPNSINTMLLKYEPHPNEAGWGLASADLPERRVSGNQQLAPMPAWEPLKYLARDINSVTALLTDQEIGDFSSMVAHSNRTGGERGAVNDDAVVAMSLVLLKEYPRNAAFIGPMHWPLILALIAGNPGIDLFIVRPWAEGVLEDPTGDPGMISQLLANSSYRGFARVLSNRAHVALDNLAASDPLAQQLDLIVIDRGAIENDFARTMARALERLSPGGALVLIDEQRRVPEGGEEMHVFLGRLMAQGALDDAPQEGAHHGVFMQADDEAERGAAYDAVRFGSLGVALIRKRPEAAQEPHALAAE
jgi:hypothetical protein